MTDYKLNEILELNQFPERMIEDQVRRFAKI